MKKKNKKTLFIISIFALIILIMITANKQSYLITEIEPPEGGVKKLFTINDKLLAISQKNNVYIWDWNNLLSKPQKYTMNASQALITKDNHLVWIPTANANEIVIKNMNNNSQEKHLTLGLAENGKLLRTSHNGEFAVIGIEQVKAGIGKSAPTKKLHIGLIDAAKKEMSRVTSMKVESDQFSLNDMAISENGDLAVAIGNNNGPWIAVIDTKQKKFLWQKKIENPTKLNVVAIAPDGKRVYTGGDSDNVYCLDALTGDLARSWTIGNSKLELRKNTDSDRIITAINISPDNKTVVVTGRNTRIYICDPATGRIIEDRDNGGTTVGEIAFSPDSTLFATSYIMADRTIKIWKTTTSP